MGYLTGGLIFSRNVCSPPQQPNYKMYYIFCIFIIDDKNTQIVIVFIITHKNTINIMYLVAVACGGEQTFRENIHPPPLLCSPRGVFANLRVTFKLLLLNSDRTTIMGGFFLPSTNNVFNFWIGTIPQ